MSRAQLALNVSDIDEAVAFYSKLFATEPAKRMPGYANFAIDDPPLKLVLIESADERGSGVAGALNHLGVEVGSVAEIDRQADRLAVADLETTLELATTCCYAVQDRVVVHDPDGLPWETYVVRRDAPASTGLLGDGSCCAADRGQPVELGSDRRACC